MEHKDWILLFVPIVANGIILYFVQMYFQSKIKSNEHKTEVRQKVNSEFFELLLDSKFKFRTLNRCISKDYHNLKLIEESLENFNTSLGNVVEYYRDYNFYLKKYAQNIGRLQSVLAEYSEFSEIPRTLSEQERNQMVVYLNKTFKELSDAADCYVKEI